MYNLIVNNIKVFGIEGNYSSPSVPTAPTNGIVDDVNNTFNFTFVSSYDNISSYEYTLDAGETYFTLTSKPLSVGNNAYNSGFVGVRLKAANGKSPSATLFSNAPFTLTSVTPNAPVNGIVDDTNNTFNWTNTSGFVNVSDYEYTLNGGSSYQVASAKPIQIGNIAKGIGQVGVRVKSLNGNPASSTLFNTSSFNVATGGDDGTTIDGHISMGQSNGGGWVWASDLTDANPANSIYRGEVANSSFWNTEVDQTGGPIITGYNTRSGNGFGYENAPHYNQVGHPDYQSITGGHFGMIGPLAHRLNEYNPKPRKFFQHAFGNTTLAVNWRVDLTENNRFTQFFNFVKQWANQGTSTKQLRIKSVTWHQGETDAFIGGDPYIDNTAYANAYYNNLVSLEGNIRYTINQLETEHGWPHQDFLFIVVSTKPNAWANHAIVNAAKQQFVSEHPSNSVYIDITSETDYPTNTPADSQHIKAIAQLKLSETIFNLVKDR